MAKNKFQEFFGYNTYNNILSYALALDGQPFDTNDLFANIKTSRVTIYLNLTKLVQQEILLTEKKDGRTHLYKLNKKNPRTQIYLTAFNQILQL